MKIDHLIMIEVDMSTGLVDGGKETNNDYVICLISPWRFDPFSDSTKPKYLY